MKGCKAWQTIFGIICLLLTITLGTVTVVLFLPYFGGELSDGIFASINDGVSEIAKTIGIANYSSLVLGVVFALPTLLLLLAANLLLYGKRSGSIVAGCVLTVLASLIAGGVTAWFSKVLFGEHQKLYLLVLGCVLAIVLLLFIATLLAVGIAKKRSKAQTADGDEIATTVVENDNQTAEQSTDDVLFMAQDYGSVSDVADATYEHNDVLSQKVLDKLKIARGLYEKGAITKEEYFEIVNKYLVQQ